MKCVLDIRSTDRLLVIVPHPDDETLASGLLIQRALHVGAALHVIIATDGDNNPWPQRWIERRWIIDDVAQRRWGARRRLEARSALQALGVSFDAISHLGWPDGGLTDGLLGGSDLTHAVVAEINDFAPTHVIVPVLHDHHPDHSALRVIVELALHQSRYPDCARLGFLVHGASISGQSVIIERDAQLQERKERALDAHTTQMRLSAGRMRGIARRDELFERGLQANRIADSVAEIEVAARGFWSRDSELLFIGEAGRSITTRRIPLPRDRSDRALTDIARITGLALSFAANQWRLDWRALAQFDRVWIKVQDKGARLIIYDKDGWHAFIPERSI
jgi:LmbE family N-acetylglucosaminyl deacetylase